MLGQPWWTHTKNLMLVAGLMDRGFLFCAAVVPMLKAAYFLSSKIGPNLDVVVISTDISTNRERTKNKKRKIQVVATVQGVQMSLTCWNCQHVIECAIWQNAMCSSCLKLPVELPVELPLELPVELLVELSVELLGVELHVEPRNELRIMASLEPLRLADALVELPVVGPGPRPLDVV
ncbi:hypothetical protein T492DRAFT_911135 [Pavlovales sp. CCMP2436]|nr:hypothetical protein T492DRAFT_911135 [Pavlovales sp. CCMP2436]